jgi:hypothetical protein
MFVVFFHHACPKLESLLRQPHLLYIILLTRSILQLLRVHTSMRVRIVCVRVDFACAPPAFAHLEEMECWKTGLGVSGEEKVGALAFEK